MHQRYRSGAKVGFSTKDAQPGPFTRWRYAPRDLPGTNGVDHPNTVKLAGSSLAGIWLGTIRLDAGTERHDGPPPCLPRHYTARRHSLASLAKVGGCQNSWAKPRKRPSPTARS